MINIHHFGATVRLQDGRLATAAPADVTLHRDAFVQSLDDRTALTFVVEARDRGHLVRFVPTSRDAAFEERMTAYLKSTEEWAPPDRPDPAQRHFIRKKRRAAHFEARVPKA